MKYKVKFPSISVQKRFEKALDALPGDIRDEIIDKALALGDNPRPFGEPKIKPPLEVYNYTAQYRIGAGTMRILYDVDDSKRTVWLLAIRKRDERTYR